MQNNQDGGVILPKRSSLRETFINYLDCSDIEYLAKTKYSLTFKCELNNRKVTKKKGGSMTYFKKIAPGDEYGKPVNNLVVKLCCITKTQQRFDFDDQEFFSSTEQAFRREVSVQADVFRQTAEFLQPICPGIAYAGIFKEYSAQQITSLLNKNLVSQKRFPQYDAEETFNYLLKSVKRSDAGFSLGVIAMELVAPAVELFTAVKNSSNKPKLLNMGRYIMLDLAIKTGYNHNDFHQANIMIQESNSYFSDEMFRPIIIDFGRATELDKKTLHNIKSNCYQNEYVKALRLLCDNSSQIKNKQNQVDPVYKWFCSGGGEINGSITNLFEARNTQLTKLRNLKKGPQLPVDVEKLNIFSMNKFKFSNKGVSSVEVNNMLMGILASPEIKFDEKKVDAVQETAIQNEPVLEKRSETKVEIQSRPQSAPPAYYEPKVKIQDNPKVNPKVNPKDKQKVKYQDAHTVYVIPNKELDFSKVSEVQPRMQELSSGYDERKNRPRIEIDEDELFGYRPPATANVPRRSEGLLYDTDYLFGYRTPEPSVAEVSPMKSSDVVPIARQRGVLDDEDFLFGYKAPAAAAPIAPVAPVAPITAPITAPIAAPATVSVAPITTYDFTKHMISKGYSTAKSWFQGGKQTKRNSMRIIAKRTRRNKKDT
jgi:hypothetical protein